MTAFEAGADHPVWIPAADVIARANIEKFRQWVTSVTLGSADNWVFSETPRMNPQVSVSRLAEKLKMS